MKDIALVITVLVALCLSVVVVRYVEKANKASRNLDEERYSRMVAEETLQKDSAKLTTLGVQLKDQQDRMNKIEDILDQEKGVNTDLKKQYDHLVQAKADLESKLQAVLDQKAQLAAQVQTAQQQPASAVKPSAPAAVQPAASAARQ